MALPPPPSPPATPTEPEFELAGVAITSDMRRAYLVPKSGGEGVWVEEREEIKGWRIDTITENGIDLQNADRSVQLPLYRGYNK
jgi:type II secretory pathway component PulC